MKRDIRKAVEEIKSAGMEEFLHQDPSTFDHDEDCGCPKTKCTHVKKWTFVTKVTRVKKCKLITKCVRFEKKFYWTKRSFCKKSVFYRDHDCDCDHHEHSSCDDDSHSRCHDCNHHKHSFCKKKKKFDHFWYKKRNY
ncbi:CotG/ExsB N-terminal domain-containing protein [Bacillus bingmayongensis]|uniref:CotG/ExsB N-terminal domain-containing protein n=1 Tax=Bacillus bingmayongensis TaxID=1150157 RepID=UPI0002F7ADF8|nr:hypothetical protein [Bacillus bingmayongensis]MBY0597900.1 hypothetical protein [Bacillus bingmayongensis]